MSDKDTFRDIKGEIFWRLRQAFLDGEIAIHDIGRLLQDLSSIKYNYMSNGKLFIVSKKDMKKMGGHSPDYADALALAFYGSTIVDSGDAVIETKTPRTRSEDDDDAPVSGTIVGDIFGRKF